MWWSERGPAFVRGGRGLWESLWQREREREVRKKSLVNAAKKVKLQRSGPSKDFSHHRKVAEFSSLQKIKFSKKFPKVCQTSKSVFLNLYYWHWLLAFSRIDYCVLLWQQNKLWTITKFTDKFLKGRLQTAFCHCLYLGMCICPK